MTPHVPAAGVRHDGARNEHKDKGPLRRYLSRTITQPYIPTLKCGTSLQITRYLPGAVNV
jgi:hypothetical protein